MNSIATKLSLRWSNFFVCLFICVVFLQTADSYSNELTFLAHPMPIEYLLVQVCTFYFFGVFLFLMVFKSLSSCDLSDSVT